jgi:hypothetical protein
MAAVVLVVGAAVYLSVAKVNERVERKRELKAQEALERGFVEEISSDDETTGRNGDVPVYNEENQHPSIKNTKRSTRHSGSRLKQYLQGRSDNGMKQ